MITIIEDTRQQEQKHNHVNEYFYNHGIRRIRSKLPFGDYALLNNLSIVIDTKKDMLEISSNICGKEHERFRNECLLAQSTGIKLIVLIEDENIIELNDVKKWKSPVFKSDQYYNGYLVRKKGTPKTLVQGETLFKAMKTMQEKYDVKFLFCKKENTGKEIINLLTNINIGDGNGIHN